MSLNGLLTVGIKERYLSHWYFFYPEITVTKIKLKSFKKNIFKHSLYDINEFGEFFLNNATTHFHKYGNKLNQNNSFR